MEQVKKFDEIYKKQESYNFLMFKIVKYLGIILGIFLMMIPISEGGVVIAFYSFACIGMGVTFYLRSYMVVFEDGKAVSIYKKLKWLPVSKKDIMKVRAGYLKDIMVKISAIVLAEQIIGLLLSETFTIFNMLYVIGVLAAVALVGVICILFPS